MPIYMDRHDVPGVSARKVAEVHQRDLKIQHKHNCRGLTYWFDGEKGLAFCLIEAPNETAVEALHAEAHGMIPNQIIPVRSGLVEAFLGRIRDPEKTDDSDLHVFEDPAFRIIMVTELKDVAIIKSRFSEKDFNEILQTYNNFIQDSLQKYDGRKVKHNGEVIIASFASVQNSIECAIEIQRHFEAYNRPKF